MKYLKLKQMESKMEMEIRDAIDQVQARNARIYRAGA